MRAALAAVDVAAVAAVAAAPIAASAMAPAALSGLRRPRQPCARQSRHAALATALAAAPAVAACAYRARAAGPFCVIGHAKSGRAAHAERARARPPQAEGSGKWRWLCGLWRAGHGAGAAAVLLCRQPTFGMSFTVIGQLSPSSGRMSASSTGWMRARTRSRSTRSLSPLASHTSYVSRQAAHELDGRAEAEWRELLRMRLVRRQQLVRVRERRRQRPRRALGEHRLELGRVFGRRHERIRREVVVVGVGVEGGGERQILQRARRRRRRRRRLPARRRGAALLFFLAAPRRRRPGARRGDLVRGDGGG